MGGEIINEDIEKVLKVLKVKSIKSPEKAVEAVNNMEKFIKCKKCNILWLAYQQGQIFEKFKINDNFINTVKEFGISKSTILFKISIVKFINEYPRMKKSSLCTHFLNSNFKIIKENCSINSREFK